MEALTGMEMDAPGSVREAIYNVPLVGVSIVIAGLASNVALA